MDRFGKVPPIVCFALLGRSGSRRIEARGRAMGVACREGALASSGLGSTVIACRRELCRTKTEERLRF